MGQRGWWLRWWEGNGPMKPRTNTQPTKKYMRKTQDTEPGWSPSLHKENDMRRTGDQVGTHTGVLCTMKTPHGGAQVPSCETLSSSASCTFTEVQCQLVTGMHFQGASLKHAGKIPLDSLVEESIVQFWEYETAKTVSGTACPLKFYQ